VTSAEVEVVGQDRPGPEEEEPRGPRGLYQRGLQNARAGNLGILPIVLGQIFIVVFFSFKATNFFTAPNFVNIVIQMAGTTMLAYGIVFVLLLGEIDLSISYVSGIGALVAAELVLPGSGHVIRGGGLVAIAVAIAACGAVGAAQGSIVAYIGVPSFVVTLAGFLIWQGVIVRQLSARGAIGIQDRWINYAATYYFSPLAGWVIAAVVTGGYGAVTLWTVVSKRRAGLVVSDPIIVALKVLGIAAAGFGTVAICNHAKVIGRAVGLPLAGVIIVIFLVVLTVLARRTTFGRHVYAVGGSAEAARRAGINVPRIRLIVFALAGALAAVGGLILAANIQSVSADAGGGTLLLNSIAAAVIGGVSLFGGRGEVRGAFIGAMVIATVSNGLNTAGYNPGTIYVVTGVILLLAVTLDTVARRLQVRAGR
jgi:D-xylose transport system permease protein